MTAARGAGLRSPRGGNHTTGDARPVDRTELERLFATGGSAGQRIEVRETHASIVVLTPTDAYKLKKPVNLGFLNYSTLRRRRTMSHREVALNARLAPDVYLGVERLRRGIDGALHVGGRGRVVDYLVHMRRLPDEASLASLLRSGIEDDLLRAIGERLGRFHLEAARAAPAFGPSAFFRNARQNLAEFKSEAGIALWPEVMREFDDYLADAGLSTRHLLQQRAQAGHIRDGHGDLRAEHVYVEQGEIRVIDCIEFNARYRFGDTALDFAFLVMDLIAGGYPDRARTLVGSYEAAALDSIGTVLPLYCWYRSLVRAKVAGIIANTPSATESVRLAAALTMRRHVHHALRFARLVDEPLLVVVGGLPGTGKSTVARALAGALGATVCSADETRKRLAGLGPGFAASAPLDRGLYNADMNSRVYGQLLARAADELKRGRSIVLDATFRRRQDREDGRSVAREHNARFLMVECQAPADVVLERLAARTARPDPWSDATVETYRELRSQWMPITELDPGEHVIATTSNPLLDSVDSALAPLWLSSQSPLR